MNTLPHDARDLSKANPLVAARLREWHRRTPDADYLADVLADRDSWRDEALAQRTEITRLTAEVVRLRRPSRLLTLWAALCGLVTPR